MFQAKGVDRKDDLFTKIHTFYQKYREGFSKNGISDKEIFMTAFANYFLKNKQKEISNAMQKFFKM